MSTSKQAPGSPAPPSPVKVLLLEDNPADARIIEIVLRKAPAGITYQIERRPSLSEGIVALEASPPHIILLDLHLTDCGGWETFERVHDAAKDVPIVIITGMDDDPDFAIRAIRGGAQDYFSKELASTPGVVDRIIRYSIERAQDRSELRLAYQELQEAQLQLVEGEKLKTIGRLAAGVAHEVKNPLAIVRMGLDFLETRISEDPAASSTLVDINEALLRADHIVGELLKFSTPREMVFEETDLRQVADKAVELARLESKKECVISSAGEDDLPPVPMDEGRITQVLLNLLMNGCHAMPEGGRLCVRTGRATIPEDAPEDIAGRDALMVEIEDEGAGIPEENLSRLFDPFFTTKGAGKGAGLGLPVCLTVMKLHSGWMTLLNRKDRPAGAVARIYLQTGPPQVVTNGDHLSTGNAHLRKNGEPA